MTALKSVYLDLLLERLAWPSGLVRERACRGIAALLLDPALHRMVLEQLLAWISTRQLESEACLGLLALYRGKLDGADIPGDETITKSLVRPSVLSWTIQQLLTGTDAPRPQWRNCCSEQAPLDFAPPSFFEEYSRTFVPPIFQHWAGVIEQRAVIPFRQQWAFEWSKLVDETGVHLDTHTFGFRGRDDDEYYVSIDFKLSEIYKSAYLRSLAWAVDLGRVDESVAVSLAGDASPIDLGLWLVDMGRKPDWWPTVSADDSTIDTVASQIWAAVDALWERESSSDIGWPIVYTRGRVHEAPITYDLQIAGIFQRSLGKEVPEAASIAAWEDTDFAVNYRPGGLQLGGQLDPVAPEDIGGRVADFELCPATVKVRPVVYPAWQYWRVKDWIRAPAPFLSLRTPAPYLAQGQCFLRCTRDALLMYDGDQLMGRWTDWPMHLREKAVANLSPSWGTSTTTPRECVTTFARETRSRFGWICHIRGYHRPSGYGQYQTFDLFKTFGLSQLVLAS